MEGVFYLAFCILLDWLQKWDAWQLFITMMLENFWSTLVLETFTSTCRVQGHVFGFSLSFCRNF